MKDTEPPTVVEGLNDDQDYRKVTLFGHRINEIPCFKESFLYGILCGFGSGFAYFIGTSKIRMSTHVAVGAFSTFTFIYYFYCRYNLSYKKFYLKKFQQQFHDYADQDFHILDENDKKDKSD